MKLVLRNTFIFIGFVILSIFINSMTIKAECKLSDAQKEREDVIANICIENWEKYGCLPSVAIAQSYIESNIGEHCRGYNYWGICSGAITYNSLEDGIYGYMKVINNGYYVNAPGCKDPYQQMRYILDGGYCYPEGTYYSKFDWTYRTYNLKQYDDKLFKHLEKKEKLRKKKIREKRRKQQEMKSKKFIMTSKNNETTIPENIYKLDELYSTEPAKILGIYNSSYKIFVIYDNNRSFNERCYIRR